MKKNVTFVLKHIGLSEGGLTLNKLDRGNWYRGRLVGTNHGVTGRVLAQWYGKNITARDVRDLTKSQAVNILKAGFLDTIRFDDLYAGLDLAVADWSVNSGPRRASKGLQRSVGAKADGYIGGLTLTAMRRIPAGIIIRTLMKRRLSFLQRLRGKNGWPTFGKGWGRRVQRVLVSALKMANGD